MDVGASATRVGAGSRAVTACVVPTRGFAASFAALGYLLERNAEMEAASSRAEHYRHLCELAPGTPVTVERDGRTYHGVLRGTVQVDGVRRLKVQTTKNLDTRSAPVGSGGGLTYLLDEEQGHSVALDHSPVPVVRLPAHQAGHHVEATPECLNLLYGKAPTAEVAQDRLDCLIVGSVSTLWSEWSAQLVGVESSTLRAVAACRLVDLLRVRRFVGSHGTYRSEIASSAEDAYPATDEKSPAVIYDGSAHFVRWYHALRGRWTCVIIDARRARLEEAVGIVNQEFQQRAGDWTLSNVGIPLGVEVMSYLVPDR